MLRDYKTGKAPRDDGGIFRGGKQLQIPFYILAAQELFPARRSPRPSSTTWTAGGRSPSIPPRSRARRFRAFLAAMLDVIGGGVFVQEPSVLRLLRLHRGLRAQGPASSAGASTSCGDRNLRRALGLKDVL